VEPGDRGSEYNTLRNAVEKLLCAYTVKRAELNTRQQDLADAMADQLSLKLLDRYDKHCIHGGLQHLARIFSSCSTSLLAHCKVCLVACQLVHMACRCSTLSNRSLLRVEIPVLVTVATSLQGRNIGIAMHAAVTVHAGTRYGMCV
jgi:hypothetical protein